MIPQIDPRRASELMQNGHVYVDVRTVEEFSAGHAAGAVNVPAFLRAPSGQMAPNPEFVQVMAANFQRDTPLVVGCMMGGRSQRACELLAGAGYSRVHNIAGGFGGAKDPFGRVVVPGWMQLGLPVSQENGDGVGYDSLRAKASGTA
jgi:rhodanese-related sulfurtransferase